MTFKKGQRIQIHRPYAHSVFHGKTGTIIRRIKADIYIIVLDERLYNYTSEQEWTFCSTELRKLGCPHNKRKD